MVTEEEKRFVAWWKDNRDREKKVFRQWLIGLPIGLLFVVPIIVSPLTGWYKRANMWARTHNYGGLGLTIMIAGLLIITFIAIFYKRHKWDMYEQQYLDILSRMGDKPDAPPGGNNDPS